MCQTLFLLQMHSLHSFTLLKFDWIVLLVLRLQNGPSRSWACQSTQVEVLGPTVEVTGGNSPQLLQ